MYCNKFGKVGQREISTAKSGRFSTSSLIRPSNFTVPYDPNLEAGVPRVNDRRILNGIFSVLRLGAPWRDLPDNFGPYTTCCNRFVRWRRADVWADIIPAHFDAYPLVDLAATKRMLAAQVAAKN